MTSEERLAAAYAFHSEYEATKEKAEEAFTKAKENEKAGSA